MKKTIFILLWVLTINGSFSFAVASTLLSPERYLLKCGDFQVTKITAEKSGEQFVLNVSIYFKQSSSIMLPYPCLRAVTSMKGDTLGTGYREYFCHNGQDTVVYHITLRKNEIPRFEECLYCFIGPGAAVEEDDECKLTYAGAEAITAPEPCALDGSKLKITGIKVYNPKGILPELEVSIYFDAAHNQMLPAPYLKSAVENKKTVGDGYKSHKEYYCHQGKDTLVYHIYLRKDKIPDLSKCEFYFCTPGKLGSKDAQCKLKYRDQQLLPASQKNEKK